MMTERTCPTFSSEYFIIQTNGKHPQICEVLAMLAQRLDKIAELCSSIGDAKIKHLTEMTIEWCESEKLLAG